ncbi:MAG: hypothetical protein LDL50_06395 [Chloroflexi bacterium]|nr:hypothetical protein [Chloroflexota bacterium]MCA2000813.1 hypothetical protein [Chloroflexota bacterium]
MKKRFISLAIAALTFAALACNMGATPPPATPSLPDGNATDESIPTPAEFPLESQPAGECANPYLPVVTGASWSYKMTGSASDTFTRSIVAVDEKSFTDQDVFDVGVARQGKWECESGNLKALNPSNGVSSSVNTENLAVDFQTTASSGVTLPAAIRPGDAWEQALTLEGSQTVDGLEMPAKNDLKNTCKAVGLESVSVEAGTFNAMRVECVTTMSLSLNMQGVPLDMTLTLNGINWYAENIGMVKSTSSGQGFESVIELLSYSIP